MNGFGHSDFQDAWCLFSGNLDFGQRPHFCYDEGA